MTSDELLNTAFPGIDTYKQRLTKVEERFNRVKLLKDKKSSHSLIKDSSNPKLQINFETQVAQAAKEL